MPETRLGGGRLAWIAGLSAMTLGVGLGGAGRLSYHEAITAQSAREMLATGDFVVPTIGGLPWLEKPPLATWLVAGLARLAGAVDEVVARAPSAVAGGLLAVGVAVLAARRFGAEVGFLAGLIQATMAWTIIRGRLAEGDILLACLLTWTILAFDRWRTEAGAEQGGGRPDRLAFFVGLGVASWVKGIGFGAVLAMAVVVLVVAWDRDWRAAKGLRWGVGWGLAAALTLAWPALVLARYPAAANLWTLHVRDRLAAHPEHFASASWWPYGPGLLGQVLPWTPLAMLGAWRSLGRAATREGRGGGDRLLWAWAVGPLALLSLATVKNAHYAIHALPPWSIWAALSLSRLGNRLEGRGWSNRRVGRCAWGLFAGLGLVSGLLYGGLAPWCDRRGVEWSFYERAGRALDRTVPLVLLYDDWDRNPYPTPFGPVPHDLAVRLFYLERPATWQLAAGATGRRSPFAVIARDRDLPALRLLGRVETLLRGPTLRSRYSRVDDRTFALFRVSPAIVAGRRGDGPSSESVELR